MNDPNLRRLLHKFSPRSEHELRLMRSMGYGEDDTAIVYQDPISGKGYKSQEDARKEENALVKESDNKWYPPLVAPPQKTEEKKEDKSW